MRKYIVPAVLTITVALPLTSAALASTTKAPGKVDPKVAPCLTAGTTTAVARVSQKGQCTGITTPLTTPPTWSTSPPTSVSPSSSTPVLVSDPPLPDPPTIPPPPSTVVDSSTTFDCGC